MRETADGAWLAAFAKHLSELALSPTTIVNYLADVRAFASWYAEHVQPERPSSWTNGHRETPQSKHDRGQLRLRIDVRPADILHYRQYLETVEQRARSTVNRRLQALRKFCHFAVRAGWMDANPALEVTLLPEPEPSPPRTLSPEEEQALLRAVQSAKPRFARRDRAILELLLGAGLRVSEVAGLMVNHVIIDDTTTVIIVAGGNGYGSRHIPLNGTVSQALREYLATRPAGSRSPYLFLSQQGRPISTRSIQRLVAVYAHAAGLEGVSAYTLRHTCAVGWIRQTGDLETVARLLGHQRLETTAKYINENA